MVKKISEKEFHEVNMQGVSVVDFSATWCGPCQMLAPVLEEVSEELDGQAAFYKVDVDENPGIAQKYQITNIPALILFKNGEAVERQIGFQPKDSIKSFVQKHIS